LTMVAPLNYAASAIADIKGKLSAFGARDQAVLKELVAQIERSVHFSVPDNGRIFSDGFKGIRGCEVRLPFGEITIEYFVSKKEQDPGLFHAPRRLIVASMERTEEFAEKIKSYPIPMEVPGDVTSEYLIKVVSVCDLDMGHGFVPMYGCYCILCSGWDDYGGTNIKPILEYQGDNPGVVGFPIVFLPDFSVKMFETVDGDVNRFWQCLCTDVAAETAVTMELCEALTCSNVGITTIQKVKTGVNERRVRDGKLPLYEVKALEIIATGREGRKEVMYGNVHEGRSGPRQHLRRGHIRRLEDGKKVWVSSCVVGDRGRIDKTYSVRGLN
jgi:hypothetical protein